MAKSRALGKRLDFSNFFPILAPPEKTPETYHLCIALDEVWAEQKLPEFLKSVPLEAGEEIHFWLALSRLMQLYEELISADSSLSRPTSYATAAIVVSIPEHCPV